MCQLCLDSAKKHFPGKTDQEYAELLWGATAFPFDDPEGTDKQLAEMAIKSGGDIHKALCIADQEMSEAHDRFKKDRAEAHEKEYKHGKV